MLTKNGFLLNFFAVLSLNKAHPHAISEEVALSNTFPSLGILGASSLRYRCLLGLSSGRPTLEREYQNLPGHDKGRQAHGNSEDEHRHEVIDLHPMDNIFGTGHEDDASRDQAERGQ